MQQELLGAFGIVVEAVSLLVGLDLEVVEGRSSVDDLGEGFGYAGIAEAQLHRAGVPCK